MERSHTLLVKWTIDFIRNKDIIFKKIECIENGKDGFDLYVKYNDRNQYFIIMANIDNIDLIIERLNNEHYFSIVTLNSKNNFDVIFVMNLRLRLD